MIKLLHIKIIDNAGRKKNKAFAYKIYMHFTQQCMKRNQKLLDLENLHMFKLEKTLFIYAPYLIKDSRIANPSICTMYHSLFILLMYLEFI